MAFADIFPFVPGQMPHDRLFRFLPLRIQPVRIDLFSQPDGKLIIQIQHLIKGFIFQEAIFRTHHQGRKMERYIRRIGFAVVQPQIYDIPVFNIDRTGQHAVEHVLIFKSVDLLPVSYTHLDVYKRQDLIGLTDLVGKSDAEVTAVLGQGKEMKNSEGILLERDYTLPILGENADVSLSFNLYQEGAGLLEQAVINLGQADLDEYAQTLTQLFGEPTEKYEKSYFFVSGNKTLVLADPYDDGAYIETVSYTHLDVYKRQVHALSYSLLLSQRELRGQLGVGRYRLAPSGGSLHRLPLTLPLHRLFSYTFLWHPATLP